MFGSESWALTKKQAKQLEVVHSDCLRRSWVCGVAISIGSLISGHGVALSVLLRCSKLVV